MRDLPQKCRQSPNPLTMEITRHFTATTFVVCQGQVLLHLHPKLGLWLPPGGHIERDELPEKAALREVWEETGLKVDLYHPDSQHFFADGCQHLHRPQHLLLENINPFHQHIDFIYYAQAQNGHLLNETVWQWFNLADVQSSPLPIPENVRLLAAEAIQQISLSCL